MQIWFTCRWLSSSASCKIVYNHELLTNGENRKIFGKLWNVKILKVLALLLHLLWIARHKLTIEQLDLNTCIFAGT